MPRWPLARDDADLRLAYRLLIRLPMSEAVIPRPKPYRMSADVMEIDIAHVIATLEAEQTLVVSRRQLATLANARRRRSVGGFMRWLLRRG